MFRYLVVSLILMSVNASATVVKKVDANDADKS